jgi:hypothetical protein
MSLQGWVILAGRFHQIRQTQPVVGRVPRPGEQILKPGRPRPELRSKIVERTSSHAKPIHFSLTSFLSERQHVEIFVPY